MNAAVTMRHWMHQLHDGSVKTLHVAGHLFHEKSFWGIVIILAMLTALFTLLVLFGKYIPMEKYSIPTHYGPYY